MKTKKRFSAVVVGLALSVGLLAGLVAGAGAAGLQQKVTATLDQTVSIKLDGEVVIPKDANGNRVYPIMYSGTTYLPVRAVGNMVGLNVDWDQASRTVLLGNSADGVDLIDSIDAYYRTGELYRKAEQVKTSEKKTFPIQGINCSHWICLGLNKYANQGVTSRACFDLQGKYKTITFKYYSPMDTTLRVMGDNDYMLAEIQVKGSQVPQTKTVDLLNCSQLTFEGEKLAAYASGEGSIYIFDAHLK